MRIYVDVVFSAVNDRRKSVNISLISAKSADLPISRRKIERTLGRYIKRLIDAGIPKSVIMQANKAALSKEIELKSHNIDPYEIEEVISEYQTYLCFVDDFKEYKIYHEYEQKFGNSAIFGSYSFRFEYNLRIWGMLFNIFMMHREKGISKSPIAASIVLDSFDYNIKRLTCLGEVEGIFGLVDQMFAMSEIWDVEREEILIERERRLIDAEISRKIISAINEGKGIIQSEIWKRIDESGSGKAYIIDILIELKKIAFTLSKKGKILYPSDGHGRLLNLPSDRQSRHLESE